MSNYRHKAAIGFFVLLSVCGKFSAQSNDSIQTQEVKKDSTIILNKEENTLSYKKLIIPTALIGTEWQV